MSDPQHSHTPEKFQPSEFPTPDLTSDNMSSTETLIPVDAVLAEESVPGYTEKDSANSSTPDTSASSHEDEAAEGGSYSLI